MNLGGPSRARTVVGQAQLDGINLVYTTISTWLVLKRKAPSEDDALIVPTNYSMNVPM